MQGETCTRTLLLSIKIRGAWDHNKLHMYVGVYVSVTMQHYKQNRRV